MPRALLHDPSQGRWLAFGEPREEHAITDPSSLPDTLRSVAAAVESEGLWAVTMLSYESAPAFDPSLIVYPPDRFPLAWLALFDPPRILSSLPTPEDIPPRHGVPAAGDSGFTGAPWRPSIGVDHYAGAIRRIRELIASGDTYQVNFSFRLRRESDSDPYSFFRALVSGTPPPFAAYLEFGTHAICSLSPELFFRLDGDLLASRPMKGTSRRGLSSDDDLLAADRLRRSPKNRAENIMIVDMVRNDLGKVARPGSVAVSRMYDVEQYPTVWQMTSTVEARTDATVPEILTALFPPASITGAPKVRTMEIIRELEDSPRHMYTGATGWMAPGRIAQFSVAIRTLLTDRSNAEAEYGVGGGIVWDSDPLEEYEECLTKAAVLARRPVAFSLLETLLWTPGAGFVLLDDHLSRLRSSARYFGFAFDEAAIRGRLGEATSEFVSAPHRKVRLLLTRTGEITVESASLEPLRAAGPPDVRLAVEPVDIRDPFLYHKTTQRDAYDRARERAGPCDDVILWNERHEITESCIANVVVSIDGTLFTPPVACGLLGGVARARALRSGTIRERVIRVDDVRRAERIFLTNAVRGLYEVRATG